MSIQPHRSKFKKCTTKYVKDNLLDIIDISERLSKNRYIHKCPLNNFIYSSNIINLKLSHGNKENNKSIENKPEVNAIDTNNENSNSNDISTDNSIKNFEKSPKELKYENINFNKLNHNKFKINFMHLKLEYENDYSELFIKKYFPLEIIGTGAFGLVVSVIDIKEQQKLAVKIIDKGNLNIEGDIDIITYQVKLINKLDSPRIMKIFNVLETQKYIFIFMELIEGGNLKDLIIRRYLDQSTPYLFRDSECSLIMKGILESLNYLHKNNIIHRDIKPENILFKNKNDLSSVVLCDFGFAYQLEYDKYINDSCGTTIYMAPEIFQHRGYDFLVDSFSAGIVLFELCSGGMHPFLVKGMKKKEYIEKMRNFNEVYTFSKEMPLLARNLFLKLCKSDPNFRYGTYKALKHPWITRSNQSQIPMTLLEEYNKTDKIINFKALLATGISLIMIKNYFNMKPKISESDSTFNESMFDKSITKRKKLNINKIININNINLQKNILKPNEKFNYKLFTGFQSEIKPSIPLLKTCRIAKKSKKNLFPKIRTDSLKKYKSKEKIKENNDSKQDIKNNIVKNRRTSVCLPSEDIKKRNNLFLRTFSCNRNKNKKELNDDNYSFFSNSKNAQENNNINNIKTSNLCDNILKYREINYGEKENDRYVLKNSKNPLIFSTHENKKNKTLYLLSLNEKQIQKHNSYINNINKYIAKNRKNFHSTNKSVKIKKNNRIFCTKDILTNIEKI